MNIRPIDDSDQIVICILDMDGEQFVYCIYGKGLTYFILLAFEIEFLVRSLWVIRLFLTDLH
jgi:hypothetical protein